MCRAVQVVDLVSSYFGEPELSGNSTEWAMWVARHTRTWLLRPRSPHPPLSHPAHLVPYWRERKIRSVFALSRTNRSKNYRPVASSVSRTSHHNLHAQGAALQTSSLAAAHDRCVEQCRSST